MKNKLIFTGLITLGAFFLQLLLVPYLSVNNIKPDLIAVAVIYCALILGPFHAMIFTFVIGLIVDSIGGFPLGTTAFVYIWTVYLIGFFRNYEFWLSINFIVITILGVLFIRTALTFIYLIGSQWSMGDLFIVSVIPDTIYTTAFAGILFVFVRDRMLRLYHE